MEKDSFQKLNRQIAEYCDANQITGVLRVTQKDQILFQWTFGYADRENRTPFTENSMFTLYSMSKPFCAMGLLKLKDLGLVELDTHPSKYVPETAAFHPHVTLRQLLQHTSGIPDFEQTGDFRQKYAPGSADKIREHLKLLSSYPSHFLPGSAGMYANVNYVLAALIIENVTSLTYAEYMHREVFEPLGMKHTVADKEGLYIPDRVTGYEPVNGRLAPVEKSLDWMLGAGDLVATVKDVYTLNLAIKHGLLLTPETWAEALIPTPLNQKAMAGCTVSLWHGKHRITHNGGHTGFRTLHICLPQEDFDIIFLSNSGYGNARNDIAEMIYHTFWDDSQDTQKVEMDTGYI